MTGLERITEKIISLAQSECDIVIENASISVKEILTEARTKANILSDEIILSAEQEAERKISVAKSTAESITRNRYLEIRNAILNDIISAAYLKIDKFSDEEYFELIKKICIKNIQPGECTMYFNSYDLGRLPENFEEEINSEVYETTAVHISDKSVFIENGFILRYEGFEVNCALKAVFDEAMDRLKDSLNSVLFC